MQVSKFWPVSLLKPQTFSANMSFCCNFPSIENMCVSVRHGSHQTSLQHVTLARTKPWLVQLVCESSCGMCTYGYIHLDTVASVHHVFPKYERQCFVGLWVHVGPHILKTPVLQGHTLEAS